MTIIECGICNAVIRRIDDGKNVVELGYDGCEEIEYDEEKR